MSSIDQHLIEAIGLSPIPMVASNPHHRDNPIEAVNQAFCDLTGYSEREIIGRNCRFLAGEKTDEATTQRLRDAIHARKPIYEEILNYRSDGSEFVNGVMITPLFNDEGDLAWFLGSQVQLGTTPDSGYAARRARAEAQVAQLPSRQREVLAAMAKGFLNKQIAWQLKISEKTVKMHRALLLERLGVATSAEAIRIAVEAGF